MKKSLPATLQRPLVRALGALFLMVVLGCLFNADGTFFKVGTHLDMLRQVSRYAILACGMTLVIITAGIDLSVGSLLGLTAVCFSITTIRAGWPVWLAIPACLTLGTLCGACSGFLVSRLKVQPFIATLSMLVFARGLAKVLSGGQKVSTAIRTADGSYHYVDAPAIFDFLNQRVFFGSISVVSVILLVCVAVCWVLLYRLRWGRYLYAIGGNEESARLSGVPVTAMKLLAYGLSGFFAAVAGICHAAEEYQGDPEAGQTYELTAIAIVVIGGTSLSGGRGGILLTLTGALTIGYLEKILSINAVGEASRLMLTGLIIIGAVVFQRVKK
jgi:ribose transport system permease protein